MLRSKLEVVIDILKTLSRYRGLKLTHIMYKANMNYDALKQYLDFLIKHNLVEEQMLPKKRYTTRVVYTITKRGRTVLKRFSEVNSAFEPVEEKQKIPKGLC